MRADLDPERPRPEPACPRCGSRQNRVISLFGTQAMVLQYQCVKCRHLFEAIKYGEEDAPGA